MILFFKESGKTLAVGTEVSLNQSDVEKLVWLFGGAEWVHSDHLSGLYVGPRKEMITPWSTNAVEITQNMGINGIFRIEEFLASDTDDQIDPMLQASYQGLDQSLFTIHHLPEAVIYIDDISVYNKLEGLALSPDEIQYLDDPSNFLKLLYDEHAGLLKIVATGSSAFYIDHQFRDSLAGRKKI